MGLHVHHRDLNRKNDVLDNLMTLCNSCHSKIAGQGSKIPFNSIDLSQLEFNKEFYKPSEVMRLFGFQRNTFYRWVRNGWIGAVKLPSGRYRIPRESLVNFKELLSGR